MQPPKKSLRIAGAVGALVTLSAAGLAWQIELGEAQRLDPTSPTFFHSMGRAVALDGDTLASGAPETTSSGPGCVYVHTSDGTAWTLEQKISPPGGSPPGLGFGRSLDLQDDTLVVGAISTAFVYTRSGSTWSLQQQIPPSGTSASYASSISLDGNTAVIGQYGMSISKVWFWVRSGSTWSVQQQVTGAQGSGLGAAVAVVGNTAALGAFLDGQAGSGAGAVFIYTRSGSTWSQQVKLLGSQPFPDRRMGTSVDLQGFGGQLDLAAGGASNFTSRVVLFRGGGATWTQTAQLSPLTGESGSWFGAAVGLSEERLVVGAWRADAGGLDHGSATVYQRCGDGWIRQADLVASTGAPGDALGQAVAIEDVTVALGAPGVDGGFAESGATYVYDLATSPLASYCHGDGSSAACPCGNELPAGSEGGCRNSTGAGGLLVLSDDLHVATDKLRAYACDLLPNQPGLLFAGTAPAGGGNGLAFGDGLRCAAGTVVRLGIRVPDADGDAVWGPGLQATGGWGAGDTRYFQVWYRNPSGGPCMTGFNLTSGVQATFEP